MNGGRAGGSRHEVSGRMENKQKNEANKFLPIDTVAETVFYTMSVYFLAAKVTKTRYTLKGALLATLAGTVASVALAGWMV